HVLYILRHVNHFRQRSGDRHQPTSQQSSHKSHGQNNDRQGSDRRGGNDNHRSNNNNNYSSSNNRNSGNGRDQRNRGHQSNRSINFGSQQSRGPSEGYSYPVCTTCRRRHQGECRRAAGTCFKCGQAGHLQKDCKKNTTTSTSGQADKKPGVSSRSKPVFKFSPPILLVTLPFNFEFEHPPHTDETSTSSSDSSYVVKPKLEPS
nr:hypothetical protein [Tanacetum cinerariifolium]